MAQQMVNGSYYKGDITVTNRMTDDYAVVSEPLKGKHLKPQDAKSLQKRKLRSKMKKPTIQDGHLVKAESV